MNWITNYVRPRINSIFSRRETPDNLWTKCNECGTMLFHREVSENLNVCTNCGHHMAISPRERFKALFDGGIFSEIKVPCTDARSSAIQRPEEISDRMKAAQKQTGESEAMLVAHGEMGRTPIVAAAQDFSFMGGSMGMYVGNAIIAAAEEAVKLKPPPDPVFRCGRCPDARRHPVADANAADHGCGSDAQRGRSALYRRSDTPDHGWCDRHPMQCWAMFISAEPNALICFAGPRV